MMPIIEEHTTTWVFPKIGGFPPKSSISIFRFSIINHPFWGENPLFLGKYPHIPFHQSNPPVSALFQSNAPANRSCPPASSRGPTINKNTPTPLEGRLPPKWLQQKGDEFHTLSNNMNTTSTVIVPYIVYLLFMNLENATFWEKKSDTFNGISSQ